MKITNGKYRNLWEKVERFELDEPGASKTFTDRLMLEQNWSRGFANKAIAEYKRFMVMCVVLPEGASPSYVVDQVWHLHLTYTKSYWVDFCRNTLGKDVHHIPSKGGKDEEYRHIKWYQDTLRHYEALFGIRPPQDVWLNRVKAPRAVQGDMSKYRMILVGGTCCLPLLVSLALYQKWNMFTIDGPSFLVFFGVCMVGLASMYFWYMNQEVHNLKHGNTIPIPDHMSVYKVANFLKGKAFALNCAMINLVAMGKLEVYDESSYTVMPDPMSTDEEYLDNPLHTVLKSYGVGKIVKHQDLVAYTYFNGFVKEFEANLKHLLPMITFFPVALLEVMGILRCIQGVYHDKPIAILLFLMVALGLIVYVVTMIKLDDVEIAYRQKVRERYMHLWKEDEQYTLTRDFAIFGHKMLYLIPSLALVSSFYIPNTQVSSNDSGGGGDSGCSSSSCGSSCGGGCGGCGGD